MSYREGDSFLSSAKGRNNLNAIFIGSQGKAFTLPCHGLPSARGQGEPLTGRLNAESGETFAGVISGNDDSNVVLASDSGYGFVSRLGDLQTKNKSGKAALKIPENGKALSPQNISTAQDKIAAINSEGRMLIFPIGDLPEQARGKGNKIMNIPKQKYLTGEEKLEAIAILSKETSLKLYSGKRHFTIKPKDLENFEGSRGLRGNLLPKGFRKVDRIEVLHKDEQK